jgi:uncharacterized protein (TIGR02145 family)
MALTPEQTASPGRLRRIPLGGKPWANAYYSVGREVCTNLYMEASNTPESVSDYFAVMIPGLRSFAPSTSDGGCAGMFLSATGRCFGVFSGYFCEVLESGFNVISSVGEDGTLVWPQTPQIPNAPKTGKVLDTRDGKWYRTVLMPDGKWWTAENLDYSGFSVGTPGNRLYQQPATPINGCHIPDITEWRDLIAAIGGMPIAGRDLKSVDGWIYDNGTDLYGYAMRAPGVSYSGAVIQDFGVNCHLASSTITSQGVAVAYHANAYGTSLDEYEYPMDFYIGVRLVVDSGNVPDVVPLFPASMIQRGLIGATASATSFAEIVNTDGNHLIMLVNGKGGWTFEVESNDFAAITDEDFPGANNNIYPTFVKAIDTYFLVNVPGTNTYRWSELKYVPFVDGTYSTHWNPLNVQEMFTSASNIGSMEALNGQLWLFSERGIEVHYDTGDYLNGVWQRYQGALINIGTSAPNSVTKYGNQVFWIGSDASGTVGVFTNEGFNPKKVSTRGIDQILNDIGETNDALSFVIAEAGHIWVVFQFPAADKTFVYDPVVDAWHERSYMDPNTGVKSRWRGTFATEAFGKNLVGDRDTNAVYWSDFHAYRNDSPDGTTPNYIRWEKTLPIFNQSGQMVRFREAQIMFQQGVGLTEDAFGSEPFCSLSWADDSGMQYGAERQIPMGKQGEYKTRSRALMLGMGRNRVFKISGAAPVQTILVGMLINAEIASR